MQLISSDEEEARRLAPRWLTRLGRIIFSYRRYRRVPPHPRKILFFKFGALGDVLMTTPLVRAVREKFPDATLDYCVGAWAVPALHNNTHVSAIIPLRDSLVIRKRLWSLLATLWRLRRQKYDIVFVLDRAWQAGVMGVVIGGYCIGFDRLGEGFAHDVSVPYGREPHEQAPHDIDTYLALGKLLGCKTSNKQMVIKTTVVDHEFARQLIPPQSLSEKPLPTARHEASAANSESVGDVPVGTPSPDSEFSHEPRAFRDDKASRTGSQSIALCPGGARNPYQEMPQRRWPTDRYATLASELIGQGLTVVLLGSHADRAEADMIVRRYPQVIDCVGRTSLTQAAAILAQCVAVVAHDTALMHLASAVGTPTIALFGPTNPRRKEPVGSRHHTIWKALPCQTCGQTVCHWERRPPHPASKVSMAAITPEEVLEVLRCMVGLYQMQPESVTSASISAQ